MQIYEVLHFVSMTNRDLAKFIITIKEADFTTSFTGGPKDKSFKRLHNSFRDILETIRLSKLEKEAQHQYLQTVIDNINIGIISINEEENIELMNKKSMDLLQVPYVKSWQLLKTENTQFFEQVSDLRNEENRLVEVRVNQIKKQLTVNITAVTILRKTYRVVTFKDIKSELERKEIEAWHKLIRILTHEIMNSVTPMVSLTETMKSMLEDSEGNQKSHGDISDETIEDLSFSLQTINSRSEGLLNFVEDYRKLSKVPKPDKTLLDAGHLAKTVVRLMESDLDKLKIQVSLLLEEGCHFNGDQKLLEQVLINLITNAMYALRNSTSPKLSITSQLNEDNHVAISVSDNGAGVDDDKLDKIFVPFFSTKEHGSGIGLSLCQQIMNLHGGSIEVDSEKNVGTTFRLVFR